MIGTTIRHELAQRVVQQFEDRFGRSVLHLAYHAALPVVLNVELLHLLRLNFFSDPAEYLPYTAEADLLLSPLCREIGEGLYEIDSGVRDVLLQGIAKAYGPERIGQVVALLWQYTERRRPWRDLTRLERAQQLTALNFHAPDRADRWLQEAEKLSSRTAAVEHEWFVAMRREIERGQVLAGAIDTARLSNWLDRIGEATSRQHSAEVFSLVTQGLQQIMDADSVVLYIRDPRHKHLDDYRPAAHSAGSLESLLRAEDPPSDRLARQVRQAPRGYLEVQDAASDSNLADKEQFRMKGIHSFAGMALRSASDQEIGLLYVSYHKPHLFSVHERDCMQAFASEATIVIEQANRLRLEAEVQGILAEISQTGVNRGIDGFLDLVYERISTLLNLSESHTVFYVAFYDEMTREVSLPLVIKQDHGITLDEVRWGIRSGEKMSEWASRPAVFGLGLTEYVIETATPVLVAEDFDNWVRKRGIRVWPETRGHKRSTQSWLGVPMMVAGRIIGMMSIQDLEQEHALTKESLELLVRIADQCAIVLEPIRLQEVARSERPIMKPTCFISYAWESDAHKDWVRKLAIALVDKGVEVKLDQWDVQAGMDLAAYMDTSVRESDFILLIYTPAFARKANVGLGGVGYEKMIVTGEIYQGAVRATKPVSLLRSGDPREALPSYVRSRTYIDFRDDDQFGDSVEQLLRLIYSDPKYKRPATEATQDLLSDAHSPETPIASPPVNEKPGQTWTHPKDGAQTTLTWLHLSDLHFRSDDRQDIVLEALLRDLEWQRNNDGLCPALIFVSGDIAFSGDATEYRRAAAFFDVLLRATGLPKERLFLVPGNHDINRKRITRVIREFARTLNTRDELRDVLASHEERRMLFAGLESYADFIRTYFEGLLTFDEDHYFYVRNLDLPVGPVAILGLNSAWLARGDDDRGRLALGEQQVRQALQGTSGGALCIALMHHPFEWLLDEDRSACELLLMQRCAFVLHGHLRSTGRFFLSGPEGEAFVISASTSRNEAGYNIVRLDRETGQGIVFLRRYSPNGFWAADVLSYRNASDGRIAFTFRPPDMPSTPTYYSCFISCSSKDQAFAERLYADLQSKGVRCWFAPHDLKLGDRIRIRIDEEIRVHDKVLVILSKNSISSKWVKDEVEAALEQERQRRVTVLFPIRLDDTAIDTDQAWATELRRQRHTGDFCNWKNHDDYQKAFDRLLRDLRAPAQGESTDAQHFHL